jgi:hypothetical protein
MRLSHFSDMEFNNNNGVVVSESTEDFAAPTSDHAAMIGRIGHP